MSSEPEIGPNGLPLAPRPAPRPAVTAAPADRKKAQRPLGPSLRAMGLGFVALLLGPITGLPAIANGLVGLRRARPGSAARTHAVTGIVLGLLGTAIWGVALLAIL